MLFSYELTTNIEINTLSDLSKLMSLTENTNLKVNDSELSRKLGKDRRTIKKYRNGYIKPTTRNRSSIIDEYYDGALNLLNSITPIDILTYVPMKPGDIKTNRFDRFSSLKLDKMNKQGIHLTNIITCTKDFSQKHNDTLHRKENVRDAYTLVKDVRGKTVVVIDDIYASGSTITEIAIVLYENGAENVIALFLAVNQMTKSPAHIYKQIKCQKCDGHMVLRVSKANNLFFGCSNYPKCNFSMDKDVGLNLLNQINQITIDDIYDLEDIY